MAVERPDPIQSPRELPPIWGLTVQQDWLIEGLIPQSAVIMLSGESGSGKSTLTLDIARCVSTGTDFLGRKTAKKPVLIIDKENSLYVYHERIDRLSIQETPELMVWGQWCPWEPASPSDMMLRKWVIQEKPLIIYDSFVAFHPGSEQDADQTRDYMEGFRTLANLGGTIIVIHHTGKGENTKEYRGSSDIKASLDVGITLIAKKPLLKLLQLKPFKNREGVLDPIMVTLDTDRFQEVDSGFIQPEDNDWKAVEGYIRANPDQNQQQIVKALPHITAFKTRKVLLAGEMKGTFDVVKGLHNQSFYRLAEQQNGQQPQF